MGWPCAEIKGNATMIAEFFCRLLGLFGGCCHFVKPMALASMMALMPGSSVMASDQPVLMVLGDSLVAGHGLPQGEAFPDELGRLLKKDGVDVEIVNAGVSGDTTAGGLARLDWSLAANLMLRSLFSGAMICFVASSLRQAIAILRASSNSLRQIKLRCFLLECRHRAIWVLIMQMNLMRSMTGWQSATRFCSILFFWMAWPCSQR